MNIVSDGLDGFLGVLQGNIFAWQLKLGHVLYVLLPISIYLNYYSNIINAWRLANTTQICARTIKPWNVFRCLDHFYHIKV